MNTGDITIKLHKEDNILVNWAIQNQNNDANLGDKTLANIILTLINNNPNNIWWKANEAQELFKFRGAIGDALIDFLDAFRFYINELCHVYEFDDFDNVEIANIYLLPINYSEKSTKTFTRSLQNSGTVNTSKFYLEKYSINNKVIGLIYVNLIESFLKIIKMAYHKEYTYRLKKEFFDIGENDDEYDEDYRNWWDIDSTLYVRERMEFISEVTLNNLILELGDREKTFKECFYRFLFGYSYSNN